jgi:hypothetical protein
LLNLATRLSPSLTILICKVGKQFWCYQLCSKTSWHQICRAIVRFTFSFSVFREHNIMCCFKDIWIRSYLLVDGFFRLILEIWKVNVLQKEIECRKGFEYTLREQNRSLFNKIPAESGQSKQSSHWRYDWRTTRRHSSILTH